MDINLIAQILGFIGFVFYIISSQMKNKNGLLIVQLISNVFYTLSYFFLKALSGFLIDFLSIIRCLIFSRYKKKDAPIFFPIIFIIISIVIGFFTVHSILDIIPILISIIYIISTWQSNMKLILFSYILAAIFWIIYNLYVGAYTPVIGNIFEIIFSIIAIYRLKRNNNL